MSVSNYLKSLYFAYLSSPASDRPAHRAIRHRKVRNILEIGIGIGRRAARMIEAAQLACPSSDVRYTGIDLFEDRIAADGPGVTLKMAHRLLKTTGARIQLVPGDSFSALARMANVLRDIDLVIISSRQDPKTLAKAWFYMPRILHSESLVLLEKTHPGGKVTLRPVPRNEIEKLAQAPPHRRAA